MKTTAKSCLFQHGAIRHLNFHPAAAPSVSQLVRQDQIIPSLASNNGTHQLIQRSPIQINWKKAETNLRVLGLIWRVISCQLVENKKKVLSGRKSAYRVSQNFCCYCASNSCSMRKWKAILSSDLLQLLLFKNGYTFIELCYLEFKVRERTQASLWGNATNQCNCIDYLAKSPENYLVITEISYKRANPLLCCFGFSSQMFIQNRKQEPWNLENCLNTQVVPNCKRKTNHFFIKISSLSIMQAYIYDRLSFVNKL